MNANQPTLIELPPNFRELLLDNGEQIIAEAFEHIGLGKTFPKTSSEAMTLCVAMGYDATYATFIGAVHDGRFDPPGKFGVNFAWQAGDVVRWVEWLDDRRRWLPGFHSERKTPEEVQRDERDAAKGLAMLDYLLGLSFEELETNFANSADESFRELIRMAHSLKRAGHQQARRFTPSPARNQQCPS